MDATGVKAYPLKPKLTAFDGIGILVLINSADFDDLSNVNIGAIFREGHPWELIACAITKEYLYWASGVVLLNKLFILVLSTNFISVGIAFVGIFTFGILIYETNP